MKPHRQESRGFTLIELVVVVGLVGLVLAFLLPATVSFMRSGRVAGASETLIADVHYARSLAASQRRTYNISFRSGTYSIYTVSPPSTTLARKLPSGVTCTASDTARFYPWGLTSPITVRFTNSHTSEVLTVAANGSVMHD